MKTFRNKIHKKKKKNIFIVEKNNYINFVCKKHIYHTICKT